ncbi:VWA domain-containing protein [Baia soyae]|uniref:von Willebrand factor type A domain-containing protein n=1 Tax=Baia soyae TaxID=1544746 RepID=A0A4R2RXI5_9BACL|nr:VWA domain-containing protein [Baia soyae]TCP69227.1 von Willebrand factor type A domain-containing protein [Baia soyae]
MKHTYKLFLTLLCTMLVLPGCSLLGQQSDKQKPEKKQEITYKPPKPLTKWEEIVKDDGKGIYAADRYDMDAVWKELDKVKEGLTVEEYYAEVLRLVGDSYNQEEKQFEEIKARKYQEPELLTLDPQSPDAQKKVQELSQEPKQNVVILLDASGSMNGTVEGQKKMELAKSAVNRFVAKLSPNTNLTLRVYGHKGSNDKNGKDVSCQSTEAIYGPKPYESSFQSFTR